MNVDDLLLDTEQRFLLTLSGDTLSTLMIDQNDFSLSVAGSLTLPLGCTPLDLVVSNNIIQIALTENRQLA